MATRRPGEVAYASQSVRAADERQAVRWIPMLGGGALALLGLRRGALGGTVLALAGSALIYRGATGHWPTRKEAGMRGGREIRVIESVTISRAPQEVYRFWRNLENLSRFMRHLQSVEVRSDGRSRWRASIPGTEFVVEWDAEMTDDREGELIAWRSLPHAALYNEGTVNFLAAPGNGGTEVRATILYRPPGGAIEAAVARLLNALPAQMVREDLRRCKQALETGEVPTIEGQPAGTGQ